MSAQHTPGPVIRDQFGGEAFLTLARWVWENSVSTRRRPSLNEMRALWLAIEQAKANETIAMREASEGFAAWWGDRFAHVEERDAAEQGWRAAIAAARGQA